MVVFVDYDQETLSKHRFLTGTDAISQSHIRPGKAILSKKLMSLCLTQPPSTNVSAGDGVSVKASFDTSNSIREQYAPNRNAFSAALSCYPIAKEIARSIDLNTLYALSGTCRQFYANLAPYRQQLTRHTLRCENEYIETLSDMLSSSTAIPDSVKSVIRLVSQGSMTSSHLTSGKISKCARDMVAECHGCSKVVCRNCTAKPPSGNMLKNRLRRLCTSCRTAPLTELLPHSPSSHLEVAPSSPLILPDTCKCEAAAWLCYHCGQKLRRDDTTYRRVWTWRTRYSTYLGGGLGTGIGEGCQGVKCGREENCLAAQEIELEVECEADDSLSSSPSEHGHYYHGQQHRNEYVQTGSHNYPAGRVEHSHREEEEPGYFRQEIIGIGGVVKQKAKKRIAVGACVVEHEDERETGRYLTREADGTHRSWCGWCWRVVPAKSESLS